MRETKRDENGRILPGYSGNYKGRPKRGTALSDLLRGAGDEINEYGEPNKVTVVRKLWEMAVDGDLSAIRLLYDRCEGLAHQSVDVDAETELFITYVNDWRAGAQTDEGETDE